MHHLIQRGKLRSQVINVPEGLPELLSDITREVLRCQPTSECLCQFIIDYLHSMIMARDKARIVKSAINQALNIVDDVIGDMCICDIPKEKIDYMCEAMEECFRRFLAQRRCEMGKEKEIIKFNESDMLDQLVKKCKFTDDELKLSRPAIEAAYQKFVNAYMTAKDTTEGIDNLYQYFREREIKRMEEKLRIEAAVKIQSRFRGFLTRRSLFLDEPIKPPSITRPENEQDVMQLDMAARKIQQFFRRHISLIENTDEEKQLQDPCSPASNLSLTAHPVDQQGRYEEKPHEDKQDDHIDEVNVDTEPINDNVTEEVQDD
ncbi:uncharacterized protein LOC111690943 [Lucilia cuprina]|uniref:uncharacterized protein LOC111690943 n=1 Tax=Lucilia cuprina TaxID=7375 RepID=UPI001F0537F6|nr:uncharacterized protein LOC111690943 [Lucilia cuprina]